MDVYIAIYIILAILIIAPVVIVIGYVWWEEITAINGDDWFKKIKRNKK